ncbi:4'-phosphopantetheinyl transferase superfamily protein [Microbacterium sp. BWT-B31]|uniref:4'-phosphopantetheinyl transferase family protein n=1 Tax=Microbacterium sp. BWT-B31 TaxID=3232072 RepID=UPI003528B675
MPASDVTAPTATSVGVHLRAGSLSRAHEWSRAEAALLLGEDAASAEGLAGRRRTEYLTTRAWVREIVHDRWGLPWRGFEHTARGEKPRLRRARPADAGIDVSIAHSGGALVVAVARHGLVGVDIETVAPVFDQPALRRRLCTPDERRRAESLGAHARRAWLTQLWTVKESYAKALGTGLALDFASLESADLLRRAHSRSVLLPPWRSASMKAAVSWVGDTDRLPQARV